MKVWTPERDEIVRRLYLTQTSAQIAAVLGVSENSVRQRCYKIGLNTKHDPHWTAEEDALLRRAYASPDGPVNLPLLQQALGRIPPNIVRRAKQLGLKTNPHRTKSEEVRQAMSDRMVALTVADGPRRGGASRGSAGARADLGGLYVRSRWEANYARYLNLLVSQKKIASWAYEAHTFVFDKIKRGTRTYTPDFKVIALDGSHEWHEVKGFMDRKSATRLDRMGRYHPKEKIVLIRQDWFKQAAKQGLPMMIANWERSPRVNF